MYKLYEKYMYKLIAIDLDGTLLNSYGVISEIDKEAIKKAIKKGVKVILTSGRGTMSVKNFANELEIDGDIICGNGAIIYNLQEDRIIYNQYIDKKKVLQIIKICEENSIYYNVFTEDTILTSSLAYNVLFYNQENIKKPDSKKTNINIIPNIYKYVEEREKEDYLKICICDKNDIIFGGIMKKLKEVKNVNVMEVAHMARKLIANGTDYVPVEYYITEIMNQDADKWNAVKFLADKYGISTDEVITIGDNVNDEQMLKNAGIGVAMGNSAPYIQEMAKEVTLDNNSGGVANVIEKHILK